MKNYENMNLLIAFFDSKRCTMHYAHYDPEEESQLYLTSHDSGNNSISEDMTVSSIFIHFLTSDYVLSI